MKQNSIDDLPRLRRDNLANIFNVYEDASGLYYYNLLQTISFPRDLPSNLFELYTIRYGDTWPHISYKVYNTINLWWLILLANDILDPTKPLEPGKTLRIPIQSVVSAVLAQTTA